MKVLVLSGGDSPEREVSIRSGKSVADALIAAGHDVQVHDPIDIKGLEKKAKEVDVVFPILHGANGEDGTIQLKLESMGVKFLGAGSESSRNSFNKIRTHEILEAAGVRMPKYSLVSESDKSSSLFQKPYVLKPFDGGSSVDTHIAREVNDKNTSISNKLLDKYDKLLLEELIEGTEITVSVLGDKALPVITIIPPSGGEFDYENKYNGLTQEICPTPEKLVDYKIQEKAQRLAELAHRELDIRHLSRTDLIVSPDGELYVLEVNTIPGLTDQSLFPKSASVSGLDMPMLADEFVKMVIGE